MANNKGKNQQAPAAETLTKQQKHEIYMKNKIERAGQDDTTVISQKTRDTSQFTNLINVTDNLLFTTRMNVGIPGSKVTIEKFQQILNNVNDAKETINSMNAEMCKILGRDYRPPRGFSNPLKKAAQNNTVVPIKKEQPKQKQKQTQDKPQPVAVKQEEAEQSKAA